MKWFFRPLNWIRYWIELFESLIGILTLTYYHPYWSFSFVAWQSKLEFKKVIRK